MDRTSLLSEVGSVKLIQRSRANVDPIRTVSTQQLSPYTGNDFPVQAMASAWDYYSSHSFPEWQQEAACQHSPQEWFFGQEELPGMRRHRPTLTVSEVNRAISICVSCPVRIQCRDYALANHEEFGIWGGLTGRDRRKYWKASKEQIIELPEYSVPEDDEDEDLPA